MIQLQYIQGFPSVYPAIIYLFKVTIETVEKGVKFVES